MLRRYLSRQRVLTVVALVVVWALAALPAMAQDREADTGIAVDVLVRVPGYHDSPFTTVRMGPLIGAVWSFGTLRMGVLGSYAQLERGGTLLGSGAVALRADVVTDLGPNTELFLSVNGGVFISGVESAATITVWPVFDGELDTLWPYVGGQIGVRSPLSPSVFLRTGLYVDGILGTVVATAGVFAAVELSSGAFGG